MISLKPRFLFIVLFALKTAFAHDVEITVSAASSLSDAFTEIGTAFEKQHPEQKIYFNFAGSGILLQQLQHGAPVDVFASADALRMDIAEKEKLIEPQSRKDFAENRLVVIVPMDSLSTDANLAEIVQNPNIKRIAIANPESVPAGSYAKQALQAAGLWSVITGKITPGHSVRQALDYVARGEVDAGFVYASDAALFSDKVRVLFPAPLAQLPRYPIAITANSEHSTEAQAFMDFVLSKTGQATLKRHGFLPVADHH